MENQALLVETLVNEFDSLQAAPPPRGHNRRPWDDWVENGTSVNPPPLEKDPQQPLWKNGQRTRVLVRGLQDNDNPAKFLNNVLLCFPYHVAYAPSKKSPIRTITGQVQIYSRLVRCCGGEDQQQEWNKDELEQAATQGRLVYRMTHEFVAVKTHFHRIVQEQQQQQQLGHNTHDTLREIMALQVIEMSNVQHVLGVKEVIYDITSDTINVVMNYCQQGDIFDLIRSVSAVGAAGGLSEEQCRYWMKQVVKGLKELSDCGFCHRDLSPENIMMDSNNALVIDLGLCLRLPFVEEIEMNLNTVEAIALNRRYRAGWRRLLTRPQGAVGKLSYMAPEIFRSKHAFDGSLADVWSAGVVLFCMLTGTRSYQVPFDLQYMAMTRSMEELLRKCQVSVSRACLELLKGMLEPIPRDRLTLDEVVTHEWFRTVKAFRKMGHQKLQINPINNM